MNKETFEAAVKSLRPKILQVGRNFFDSDDDAEDVAQETLAVLWERCAMLDEGRNIEAFAVRVAKSCCVNMVRRRKLKVVNTNELEVTQMLAEQPSPHEEEEAKEREKAMQDAVEGLSKRERQLFKMRLEEGLSAEKIAELTGIEKRSVLSIVSTVRKKVYNEIIRRINL